MLIAGKWITSTVPLGHVTPSVCSCHSAACVPGWSTLSATRNRGRSSVLISAPWTSLPRTVSLNQVRFVLCVCVIYKHIVYIHLMNIFLTAGSGSDAASLLTSAQRQGDHYILNGSKVTTRLLKLTVGWQSKVSVFSSPWSSLRPSSVEEETLTSTSSCAEQEAKGPRASLVWSWRRERRGSTLAKKKKRWCIFFPPTRLVSFPTTRWQ